EAAATARPGVDRDPGRSGESSLLPGRHDPYAAAQDTLRRSADGLELFLFSDRPGLGATDIWVSTRESVHDSWSTPVNVGSPVNSAFNNAQAYLASDRETLFFVSNRPGGSGGFDLYVTTRTRTRGQ